jgi:hypothetical protein
MRSILIIAALASASLSTAGIACAEDRYGPAPDHTVQAAQYLPTSTLSWPGKQAAPARVPAPVHRPALAPSAGSRLPTSIYAPPAATPASITGASVQPLVAPGQGAPPRFYSVAREYGAKPDSIALSPQFLADTASADLADPPPLPPPHLNAAQTSNMSSAAATNQARAASEAAQNGSEASDSTALN